MFTPPPSPRKTNDSPRTPVLENGISRPFPNDEKRRRSIGRRTKWTIILVPIILILVTASTRWLVHPMAFDIFIDRSASSWDNLSSKDMSWAPHEPHILQARQLPVSLSSSPSPSSLSARSSSSSPTPTSIDAPIPTIPSSPPVLPTPFPQPFDAYQTQNFSSISCSNFFSNMTTATAFRTCRPMSLLLGTSSSLTEAQQNLTLLNTIVWGTCNTNTPAEQCIANMGWFAAGLQDACQQDIKDRNAVVIGALTGLQAYSLVRDAVCSLNDPTSNSYCYINAAHGTSSPDLYFYLLPLGLPLPSSSNSTCSSCVKSLLGLYSSALDDPAQSPTLTGLKKTYGAASQLAVTKCGSSFATTKASNGAAGGDVLWRSRRGTWCAVVLVVLGVLSQTLLLP